MQLNSNKQSYGWTGGQVNSREPIVYQIAVSLSIHTIGIEYGDIFFFISRVFYDPLNPVAMATEQPAPWQLQSTPARASKKRKHANKDLSWNVPDNISLEAMRPLTVGRSTAADIVMQSSKVPSMLSRNHAVLDFNSVTQQWTVEDLKVLPLPPPPPPPLS